MKIQLGVIGCGFMSQGVHLPNFLKIKECHIVALADIREKVGREIARKYHIPKFYSSVERLIEDPGIDAVAAIIPYKLNFVVGSKVLKKGKHLFIEKPLTLNSIEAQKMTNLSKEKKLKLMVGYHKRFDPGCELARDLINKLRESGEMGKITFARVHNFLGDWKCGFNPILIIDRKKPALSNDTSMLELPDFVEKKDYGMYFGTWGNFCHDIDLMRYLLGEPKKVNLSSFRSGKDIYSTWMINIFDYGDYEAILETGGVDSHLWDEKVTIYFEKGWLEIKVAPPLKVNIPSQVTIYSSSKGLQQPVIPWKWAFAKEAEHFIEAISKDLHIKSSGEDSYRNSILFEAMYKSNKTKKPIYIKYSS